MIIALTSSFRTKPPATMRVEWTLRIEALARSAALVACVAAIKASAPLVVLVGMARPTAPAQIAALIGELWLAECGVIGAMWGLVLAGHRVGCRHRIRPWVQWCFTALISGSVGAVLWHLLVFPQIPRKLGPVEVLPYWAWSLTWHALLGAMLVLSYGLAARSRTLDGEIHDAELSRIAQERNLAEVHLQMLQAQIEPHFVFNALANVRRLLRTDGAGAERLLTDLLRYFEEALPRLREERSTLGREAELVRAFLAVHQVRMGPRLLAEFDVPDALAGCAVPPMLLLTLVENALKHGLQPLVEGGTIRVAAQAQDGQLTLTVADTGRGMGSDLGNGTGLANTRARLRALYGAAAALSLTLNEPRGVRATISLPQVTA